MTPIAKIKAVQTALGVVADGYFGPKSEAALRQAVAAADSARLARNGLASAFAYPADVAAYRAAKARGLSDAEAFKYGDNGVGCWNDDTTGPAPMCALPPEDWEPLGPDARGAEVLVTIGGKTITCELRDTMPRKANITNGAVIDLNPGAAKAFGLKPPFLVSASWKWA